MPESSPLGPALFVDWMEECSTSLVCEGLQGHQAKPDEKAMLAEVKTLPSSCQVVGMEKHLHHSGTQLDFKTNSRDKKMGRNSASLEAT